MHKLPIFKVLVCATALLTLTSCHPIQGIPPEGLRVVEAEPGYSDEHGALITIHEFDHSIGVHGEIYPVDNGYFIKNIRWHDEELQLEKGQNAVQSHSILRGSHFHPPSSQPLQPGFFTVDPAGIYDPSLGDGYLTVELSSHQDGDGTREEICLTSRTGPHDHSAKETVYCFLDELTELFPRIETPPMYMTATATPRQTEVTAVLASEDDRDELFVVTIDLVDEPSLTDVYAVDFEDLARDTSPYLYRMPIDIDDDGVIAVGVGLQGEKWALWTIDEGNVDEVFSTAGSEDTHDARGIWRIFQAHGQWGALVDDRAYLMTPEADVVQRDIGDINPWHENLWMKDRELALTTSTTLIVDDGLPLLMSAATIEIEEGRSSVIRRTKTARFGVELCAIALDPYFEDASDEDCVLFDSSSQFMAPGRH